MNAIYYLWCGILFSLPVWQPCQGAGEVKAEKKVEIVFKEAGLERGSDDDGEKGELQWRCRAVLFMREPWGFGKRCIAETQSLGMWDEDGRELDPVNFRTAWLGGSSRKGVSFTEIEGTAAKLPPVGCAWVRVKGCLRVPVVRTMKSPVYELPLSQGSAVFIPLPGSEEVNGMNVNDVVESGELSVGNLYVQKCEWKGEDGEKRLDLSICLDANELFEPEKFQLLDEEGKVLDYYYPNSSRIDETSQSWTADFTFSPPEKMDKGKCRVRLIYKTAPEYVSVPVDTRFGIGGEIREEPEKRAGKEGR